MGKGAFGTFIPVTQIATKPTVFLVSTATFREGLQDFPAEEVGPNE